MTWLTFPEMVLIRNRAFHVGFSQPVLARAQARLICRRGSLMRGDNPGGIPVNKRFVSGVKPKDVALKLF